MFAMTSKKNGKDVGVGKTSSFDFSLRFTCLIIIFHGVLIMLIIVS
jgi:hypothetical protein